MIKGIVQSQVLRVEVIVTKDLQHAVARTYGKAVVQLDREEYKNFIIECIHVRVQNMKHDERGFLK